ncbi:hypothetical protein Ddye_031529 [Dipteronia dyeriana]|uniref:ATPase AAA-type core domain-containing protein n=1 Tax=Dipteronia dyeriana TaxID=168575 RepID=A0AAD9WNI9_9ROSI|nr:hypothetical protein Ddye_031529 [Dipteronia dyeriana]
MNPILKQALIDDLNSIYDLELASMYSNSELRRLLVSTSNRSILVIEDIDCSMEMQNRQSGGYEPNESSQLTLSGLLNFIDGLWSSCGDERVIVFTTNHKERLDSAFLRPGRMDMHIHMSYCTPSGFSILVSNYLRINFNDHHNLFPEFDELMTEVQRKKIEVIGDEAQVGDNKRKSMNETEDGDHEDRDDQHIFINCKTKRMRSKMKMLGFVESEISQRSEVCRIPWHRPRGTNRGAYCKFNGYSMNQLYKASEIYLRTKINPSFNRVKVSKSPKEKSLMLTINKGKKIIDEFEGIQLIWEITSKEDKDLSGHDQAKNRVIELSFDKKYMEQVLNTYLSHVKVNQN